MNLTPNAELSHCSLTSTPGLFPHKTFFDSAEAIVEPWWSFPVFLYSDKERPEQNQETLERAVFEASTDQSKGCQTAQRRGSILCVEFELRSIIFVHIWRRLGHARLSHYLSTLSHSLLHSVTICAAVTSCSSLLPCWSIFVDRFKLTLKQQF